MQRISKGSLVTRLITLALLALAIAILALAGGMVCSTGSERRQSALDHSDVLSRTEMYYGPGPEMIERFVLDDGTTCYRYFHTGSNGWACVRTEP